MNKILFFSFLVIFSMNLVSDSTRKKSKEDFSKEVLWEGQITGVYKDQGKIRVYIKHNPEWVGKNFDEIKNGILEKVKYTLRQKGTDKVLGNFLVNHIELEREIKNGLKIDYEIFLFGKFKLRKKSSFKLLSNDFYIQMTRPVEIYEDPSLYFKDTITLPNKIIIHPKDKKEMIYIPTGMFIYGQANDSEQDSFNPFIQNPDDSNLKDLPSFYIDKYEVTNGEYNIFLQETNNPPPPHWQNGIYPNGKENHPVINLSYKEVEKYATWVGKRLPTEFEWEKAARGVGFERTLNRDESYTINLKLLKYPFGNKFETIYCNTIESKLNDTISVYEISTKSASPYGVIGMCGNAPEWTSSSYLPYEGHFIKNKYFGKQYKVIRGGSFFEDKKKATVYYRNFGGNPNLFDDRKAGFRLVKDLN